jgi:hypothetical protein
LSCFVTKIFSATFIIDHPPLPPKKLAHICAWGCSKYSIDLRIFLFQSLVYKVFVLVLKRERERKNKKEKKRKEVPAVKKILLLKKRKKEQKNERLMKS